MVLPAFGEKNDKNLVGCLDWSNRERKSVWNFWKVFEHMKTKVLKKLSIQSIENASIDPTSIEHRSK